MKFKVLDSKTGLVADVEKIAREEKWADHLVYCDMDGFAITQDGSLVLMDTCGNYASCPEGRFKIVMEES